MEEAWMTYLKENAPELYEQAVRSRAWAAKWRDDRIKELEAPREKDGAGLREALEALQAADKWFARNYPSIPGGFDNPTWLQVAKVARALEPLPAHGGAQAAPPQAGSLDPRPMKLKVRTENANWANGTPGKWLQVTAGDIGGFAQSMPAALADEMKYRIEAFEAQQERKDP